MPAVTVNLGSRSYDVRIEAGLLSGLGAAVAAMPKARAAVVISDSTVAGLYGQAAIDSLRQAGLAAALAQFPAGEASKTLATYSRLFDDLFAAKPAVDRDTIIVALGGGVTGDLAGFVAATALRGLRFVQCPTTLLADVDSSVGGKTGVDHHAGKNLIGAFHQPSAVLIDVETLATLPKAEISTGLAECVKHGIIRDWSLLDFIDANRDAIMAADAEVMTQLVARNVAIKAAVVSADERESGERAHLNFGHTIGHAIETLAGYGQLSHGQAVALGMVAACRLAVKRGLIDTATADRVEGLLERLALPTAWQGDPQAVLEIMRHDKKNQGGRIRMVLPTGPGRVDIFDDISEGCIIDAVTSLQP